jgi:hypothetical protein
MSTRCPFYLVPLSITALSQRYCESATPSRNSSGTIGQDEITPTYWQTMFLIHYMHIPCMILTIRNISLRELLCHCKWEPVYLLRGRMYYFHVLFAYFNDPKILTRVSPAFRAVRDAARKFGPVKCRQKGRGWPLISDSPYLIV